MKKKYQTDKKKLQTYLHSNNVALLLRIGTPVLYPPTCMQYKIFCSVSVTISFSHNNTNQLNKDTSYNRIFYFEHHRTKYRKAIYHLYFSRFYILWKYLNSWCSGFSFFRELPKFDNFGCHFVAIFHVHRNILCELCILLMIELPRRHKSLSSAKYDDFTAYRKPTFIHDEFISRFPSD